MKNLTKRNKMLLAIAGIVVVVVVVGGYFLVMSDTVELALFGASGAYIDPPMLCVNPGSTRTVTVKNVILNPDWSIGNTGIAILSSTNDKKAYVKGVAIGQTYVKAKRATYSATATVATGHVCPPSTGMAPGTSTKFVTDWTGGQWMSNNTAVATVASDGTVHAKSLGQAIIYYKMPGVPEPHPNEYTISFEYGWGAVTVSSPGIYTGWGW